MSRVDPYLPGLEHERTHDHLYYGDLNQILDLFERFARTYLNRWRKTDEQVSPDGREIYVRYDYSFAQTWQVRAHSTVAKMQEGMRAYQGGPLRAITSVPYELECHVTIADQGAGKVRLTMQVVEHIDPRRNVRDFSLGQHYLAPSFLYTEGYFGVELDPFMTAGLLGRR